MISLSRKQRYLLSVLSGLLMMLSFPFTGSLTLVAFVAWIPLLLTEAYISKKNYRSGKVFIHAYLTFFIYNLGTTWWVWNASAGGAALAFILNTLLMAIVFYGFHLTKKYVGTKEGYLSLIIYWIAFEYFHYDWESSWPWLTMGNVFSITPSWVQWYSITGVLGGSLWIMVINLLLFRAYQNVLIKGEKWKIQTPLFYLAVIFFIVPLGISLITYFSYEEKKDPIEVVALQPNLDPYTQKFDSDVHLQLVDMIDLAKKTATKETDLIVAPETAYWATIFEDERWISNDPAVRLLSQLKSNMDNTALLWGVASSKIFDKPVTASCAPYGNNQFIESYNTSLFMDAVGQPQFIHKSKLVPGVEKVPFASTFPFMREWAIAMDGTQVGYGVEEHPKIFSTKGYKPAPVICYESIFGGFVANQCNRGADLICIITNDGWWKETPGYLQHASFASLRAIENRRSVVRSANTGTSCFVNQRGDILQATEWNTKVAIKGTLNLNKEKTVYTRYGDVIGRSFGFVSIFLLLFTFVKRFKRLVSA